MKKIIRWFKDPSYRRYCRLLRATRKKLKKLAKEWELVDFQYSLNIFIEMLKSLRTYYKNGDNVLAEETNKEETREKTLSDTIKAYEDWQDAEDLLIDGTMKVEEAVEEINLRKAKFFNLIAQHCDEWWD